MSFINASIRIQGNKAWKNHQLILENEADLDLSTFSKNLYKHVGLKYLKFYKMDEMSKLGLLGAELLLADLSLIEDNEAQEIGIILANSSASLHTDIKYYNTIKDEENYFPSPALFVYTLANIVMGEIAIKQGFKGENSFFVQQKFNPNPLITQSDLLIDRGSQKALICGWIEVNEEGYDCFLYLVENIDRGSHLEHSREEILKIYQQIN